ncbi:MAG: replication-associated recombination protein A [Microbacteriaceae bacterium]|nr:replication-associated recombination protein A [Microbacteriaceae bacterium]
MTLTEVLQSDASQQTPLAVRMRPRSLDEVMGQRHLLRPGSPLRQLAQAGARPVSVILWGPPGTGKTTIAQALAQGSGRRFVELSAITAGIRDVREVMDRAVKQRDLFGEQTVLFLDEIHRFSKAQQDALLPGVENGWVTLVAATTENPSFSVISPLLSRSLQLTLQPLDDDDVAVLVDRAVADVRGLAGRVVLDGAARDALVRLASGDARRALTALEAVSSIALAQGSGGSGAVADGEDRSGFDEGAGSDACFDDFDGKAGEASGSVSGAESAAVSGKEGSGLGKTGKKYGDSGEAAAEPVLVTAELVEQAVDRAILRYDRDGDQHYDVISAFIKSIRGSNPDAALHYLARMIEGGEDARFIARRLMVHAAEDIGMADPQALVVATAAAQATQLIGLPEARLPLAEATVYLACAPKSGAIIAGIDAAIADVRAGKSGVVPLHLRDSHYPGAKAMGHGKNYRYPHNDSRGVLTQQYLPDGLRGVQYYQPTGHGNEAAVSERLRIIRDITGP